MNWLKKLMLGAVVAASLLLIGSTTAQAEHRDGYYRYGPTYQRYYRPYTYRYYRHYRPYYRHNYYGRRYYGSPRYGYPGYGGKRYVAPLPWR